MLTSRFHAMLECVDGVFYVCDLGSTNGTYVNGAALLPHLDTELHSGDRVSFGGPRYVLREGVCLRNPFCYTVELPAPLRRSKRRREAAGPRQEEDLRNAKRVLEAVMARGAARLALARGDAAQPLKTGGTSQRDCSVCLQIMVAPHQVACGHAFCGKCILTWLERQRSCPMCRADCRSAFPAMQEMQEIVEPGLTSEEQEDLKTRKKEWEQFNAGVAEAKRVHVERVARRTSAKLFVEMRRLRRVLNRETIETITGCCGGRTASPAPPGPCTSW
jgi:hypothetical protein